MDAPRPRLVWHATNPTQPVWEPAILAEWRAQPDHRAPGGRRWEGLVAWIDRGTAPGLPWRISLGWVRGGCLAPMAAGRPEGGEPSVDGGTRAVPRTGPQPVWLTYGSAHAPATVALLAEIRTRAAQSTGAPGREGLLFWAHGGGERPWRIDCGWVPTTCFVPAATGPAPALPGAAAGRAPVAAETGSAPESLPG